MRILCLYSVLFFASPLFASVFVTSDGGKISYEVSGLEDAPVVVLLHGGFCDGSDWNQTLIELSKKYRVIVPDLAGHGRSSSVRRKWTIQSFSRDIEELLIHEGVIDARVVGHSLGGLVALDLSLSSRVNITKVVLVDILFDVDFSYASRWADKVSEDLNSTATQMSNSMFLKSESCKRLVRNRILSVEPVVAASILNNMADYSAAEVLRKTKTQVSVINGDHLPTRIDMLHKFNSKIEFNTLSKSGHFIMRDQPQAFLSVLSRILSK